MGSERVERRKDRTREVIRQATLDLALEKGLESLTMDDVAERADVARGTLYNLFENRSTLVAEALAPLMQDMARQARDVAAEDGIDALAAILAGAWRERPNRIKLMLTVSRAEMDAPGAEALLAAHEGLVAAFLDALERIARVQTLRLASARSNAYLIFRATVPLLEAIQAEHPHPEPLFREMLSALLAAGKRA